MIRKLIHSIKKDTHYFKEGDIIAKGADVQCIYCGLALVNYKKPLRYKELIKKKTSIRERFHRIRIKIMCFLFLKKIEQS
jgi:hypothetical protein